MNGRNKTNSRFVSSLCLVIIAVAFLPALPTRQTVAHLHALRTNRNFGRFTRTTIATNKPAALRHSYSGEAHLCVDLCTAQRETAKID